MKRTCKAKAARGLHHHLHALKEKPHAVYQVIVRDAQNILSMGLDNWKRELAKKPGLSTIGNGLRCWNGDNLTLAKRLLAIVSCFGFNAIDRTCGV